MHETEQALTLLERSSPGALLIIVGAGISLDPPASAPSPSQVIAGALCPITSVPKIHQIISQDDRIKQLLEWPLEQMLPESFYAGIEASLGVALHREVWAPLTKTGVVNKVFNINHEIVALIAQRFSATIITPNYDSFLEAAFLAWGIRHEVVHNDSLHLLDRSAPSGCVRLIKIHGDATRPDTIVSRAPDLLRLFRALTPLNGRFKTALIAGYSGRDLDIFPWLATHSGVQRTLWLDPYLTDSHRCRRLPQSLGLIAIKEEFKVLRETILGASHESRVSATPCIRSVGDECASVARSRMSEVLNKREPLRAYLALGTVLTNIGFHGSSCSILSAANGEGDLLLYSQIRMIKALNLSCMDFFASAYHICHDLVKSGHPNVRFQARALRASCKRQYYLQALASAPSVENSPFRYGSYGRRGIVRKALRELEFILQVLLLTPAGLKSVKAASASPWNTLHPDFENACTYLETLIRLYATFQYFGVRRLNALALRAIDYWSHRLGYINGAIHVEKYANRLDLVDLPATGGVFGRLEVMGELISSTIINRDKITSLLDRRASGGEVREDLLRTLLSEAEKTAWLSGSSSLSQALLRLHISSGVAPNRYYLKLKEYAYRPQLFDGTGIPIKERKHHSEIFWPEF